MGAQHSQQMTAGQKMDRTMKREMSQFMHQMREMMGDMSLL